MVRIIPLQTIDYPRAFKTDFVLAYHSFNGELKELLDKSGYTDIFTKKYFRGLRFLENLKSRCIEQSKIFEKLKNGEGLYSMRLHGAKNIRILFDFQVCHGKEIAFLYVCFEERKTKDYSSEIQTAIKRRNEIKGI